MTTEPEIEGIDGTTRKAHYGAGAQPWDHIVAAGWGPVFAAGNALKYVRRYQQKNGEDDLAKGRWYYHRLIEFSVTDSTVLDRLELMLTKGERALLRKQG